MTLYFLAANGDKRLVKQNVEIETENPAISKIVGDLIKEYVASLNPNYKIYYTRSWYDTTQNGIMFDIGSYTEFFLLVDEN